MASGGFPAEPADVAHGRLAEEALVLTGERGNVSDPPFTAGHQRVILSGKGQGKPV